MTEPSLAQVNLLAMKIKADVAAAVAKELQKNPFAYMRLDTLELVKKLNRERGAAQVRADPRYDNLVQNLHDPQWIMLFLGQFKLVRTGAVFQVGLGNSVVPLAEDFPALIAQAHLGTKHGRWHKMNSWVS